MKKILFVCVHNSGRSQMAEAFAALYGQDVIQASSAGTQPAIKVNPDVIKAMTELGMDLSKKVPRMLTFKMLKEADKVITMGCGNEGVCPATLVPTEDWKLEDPEGKSMQEIRKIRDEIRSLVLNMINDIEKADQLSHILNKKFTFF
ncbi:MAG: arsenate reductase ArsC [Chloroflexi bacterium]|nr:arsenate reductase ArsC [Chloroflexota bacterium]